MRLPFGRLKKYFTYFTFFACPIGFPRQIPAMNNITIADKKEMIRDARRYLKANGIKATNNNIIAQIRAEHGEAVSNVVALVVWDK